MIELKYGEITNPIFYALLGKLFSHVGFPFKVAYTIGKIVPKIDQERQIAFELRRKLIEKFSEKDKKGEPVFDQDSGTLKILPESKIEFEQEFQEFLNKSFKLHYHKLKVEDLSSIQLAPNEVLMLEPLIEGMGAEATEDEEEAKAKAS